MSESRGIYSVATDEKRLYRTKQSTQISGQTGCIGHFTADIGEPVLTGWEDIRGYLKTDDFKAEFDKAINYLRSKGQPLCGKFAMREFCNKYPLAKIDGTDAYCFQFDWVGDAYAPGFTMIITIDLARTEWQVSAYVYRTDWFNGHLKNAEKGIRFITPDYETLFRIPDGGSIKVTKADGSTFEEVARYVDEYHVEIGSGSCNLYHICEYAERLQSIGAKVEAAHPECVIGSKEK